MVLGFCVALLRPGVVRAGNIPPAFARPNETIVGYAGWPVGKPTPGTSCTGTCPDGPDCECVHTTQAKFNTGPKPMRLVSGFARHPRSQT